MDYQPIFDRVIAVEVEKNRMTEGGISLLEEEDSVKKGEVIAVGEGAFEEGVFVQMAVGVGDKILFEEHSAVAFAQRGEKFFLLKQTDILAVEKNGGKGKNEELH